VIQLTFGQHQLEGRIVVLKSPLAVLDSAATSGGTCDSDQAAGRLVPERKVRRLTGTVIKACVVASIIVQDTLLLRLSLIKPSLRGALTADHRTHTAKIRVQDAAKAADHEDQPLKSSGGQSGWSMLSPVGAAPCLAGSETISVQSVAAAGGRAHAGHRGFEFLSVHPAVPQLPHL